MINDTSNELSQAVQNGEWDRARHLAAIRVAQMMERTESPRETKALAVSLKDLIDECEANDVCDTFKDSPVERILAQARQMHAEIEKEHQQQ